MLFRHQENECGFPIHCTRGQLSVAGVCFINRISTIAAIAIAAYRSFCASIHRRWNSTQQAAAAKYFHIEGGLQTCLNSLVLAMATSKALCSLNCDKSLIQFLSATIDVQSCSSCIASELSRAQVQ